MGGPSIGGPAGGGGGPAPGGSVVTIVLPGGLLGFGATEDVGGAEVRVGCCVGC